MIKFLGKIGGIFSSVGSNIIIQIILVLGFLKTFKSMKDNLGGWWAKFADENLFARTAIFLTFACLFFVIFYSAFANIFGIKKSLFMHKMVIYSLPLCILCITGYSSYVFFLKNRDPLHEALKNAKSKKEIRLLEAKSGGKATDYVGMIKENGLNWVRRNIALNELHYAVWCDIANKWKQDGNDKYFDIKIEGRTPQGKTGSYTPLMWAVIHGNENAFDALYGESDLTLTSYYDSSNVGTEGEGFFGYAKNFINFGGNYDENHTAIQIGQRLQRSSMVDRMQKAWKAKGGLTSSDGYSIANNTRMRPL